MKRLKRHSSVAAFCIVVGIGVGSANAQQYMPRAPLRDPSHITEKKPCDWKTLKQNNIVMQKRDYSCGAAALATVLQYYWGDEVSEDQVLVTLDKMLSGEEKRDRIKNGLTISDLRRAAVKMKYVASVGTMDFNELAESKVPLIVGISPDGHDHFVVYRGTNCRWVYVADPIRGNIRLTVSEFVSQWQKNAVLVVARTDREPPETSPLSLTDRDLSLGELNDQLIRTQPPKQYLHP